MLTAATGLRESNKTTQRFCRVQNKKGQQFGCRVWHKARSLGQQSQSLYIVPLYIVQYSKVYNCSIGIRMRELK